jgi:hypothetical protein
MRKRFIIQEVKEERSETGRLSIPEIYVTSQTC